jgi:TolA-binding protein
METTPLLSTLPLFFSSHGSMSDSEKVRASGVESVDAQPRYFSVTMVHRLQEQVKAVNLENSRLEETVRKQQQQVKALERERVRLTSERNRHRAAMSHCYRGIQTMLKALEDHLGGVVLIEKKHPTPTVEQSLSPQPSAASLVEKTILDKDEESEDDELCTLVQSTQDYVSDMRKIDQLLMTSSSSVSSS